MFDYRPALLAAASAFMAGAAHAEITAASDPILYWNERMTTLYAAGAPVQARGYAIANIAMHDAVNAALGGPHQSYLAPLAITGGDTRAAASQAARDVLVALNPANAAQYDAALAASLALIPGGAAKTQGIAVGQAYAAASLAARGADGSTNPGGITYATTSLPGDYRPTGPGSAALPFWGAVTPFVLSSPGQLRPGPPPALGSLEYAAALNEVKLIGASGSATRTADQTAAAQFWNQPSAAPWMQIGLLVAQDEGFSTLDLASAFGRLSTGLADALIAGFDAKYAYRLWRPLSAITLADTDGNPLTDADPGWTSLIPAPLHPSYVSTHSTLSGAGASILTGVFGDDESFTLTILGTPRTFTSLAQAAQDGADSRLWGGIHFRFDNEAGLALGQGIGQLSLTQSAFSAAVPEPASWAMMIAGFGLLGAALRRRPGRADPAAQPAI